MREDKVNEYPRKVLLAMGAAPRIQQAAGYAEREARKRLERQVEEVRAGSIFTESHLRTGRPRAEVLILCTELGKLSRRRASICFGNSCTSEKGSLNEPLTVYSWNPHGPPLR